MPHLDSIDRCIVLMALSISCATATGCGSTERGAGTGGSSTAIPGREEVSGPKDRPESGRDVAGSDHQGDEGDVSSATQQGAAQDSASADSSSGIRFAHRTEGSGIESFRPFGGPSPDRFMTEQNGGGVAIADFDRDGIADLFFTNGADPRRPAESPHTQKLFLGRGGFQFSDVTPAAELESRGVGQGCAAADYDNDGFIDLFVAAYGRDRLWRNNGDGTFSDVTDRAGLPDERQWGTSAAFADLDEDGDLDLWVVNYVDWSPDDPPCFSQHKPPVKISCSPTARAGQPDFFYRNLGDGRFEEVGRSAGVALGDMDKGLALAISDLDGDGRLDVYVANDTTPNYLFRNLGDLKFAEEAVRWGVAVSADGIAGAGMGVACGDYDGDGRLDLAVTNFLNQPKDLFQNLGAGGFRPTNEETGLDAATRPMLSFGIAFADFDLDGWPDLFVANGHIWDFTARKQLNYPYRMTQQILRNEDGRRFRDVSRTCGRYFQTPRLGRAAAIGDLDGDGDPDLVVCQHDDPPALLENVSDMNGRVTRVRLVGTRSARQPLGIQATWRIGGRTRLAWLPSGGSFQSTQDEVLLLQTTINRNIDSLEVRWGPDRVERWTDLPASGAVTIVEGGAPRAF